MLAADGLPGIPARLDTASGPDTVGEVAEITGLLAQLRHWPPGIRVFVRRVKPLRETTPKPLTGLDQLELDLQTATAGWRYEAFATNAAPTQAHENPHEVTAWLDGRHRVHARVEDHFKHGNTTGAKRLPSANTQSTPPGTASRPSPPTSSPGSNSSPPPAPWPAPNQPPGNSRSSTPRPASPAADDDAS